MAYLIVLPLMVGLILLLERTRNPFLCAGIWAGTLTAIQILFSTAFDAKVFLFTGGWFLLALGYFALLEYVKGKPIWWVVMPVGALILVGVG